MGYCHRLPTTGLENTETSREGDLRDNELPEKMRALGKEWGRKSSRCTREARLNKAGQQPDQWLPCLWYQ